MADDDDLVVAASSYLYVFDNIFHDDDDDERRRPKQTKTRNETACVAFPTRVARHRDLPSYNVTSWSIQPFGHNTRTL